MSDIYCTSFCNHGHRLVDGKPVDHECYVLPTEALHAERDGDVEKKPTHYDRLEKTART